MIDMDELARIEAGVITPVDCLYARSEAAQLRSDLRESEAQLARMTARCRKQEVLIAALTYFVQRYPLGTAEQSAIRAWKLLARLTRQFEGEK